MKFFQLLLLTKREWSDYKHYIIIIIANINRYNLKNYGTTNCASLIAPFSSNCCGGMEWCLVVVSDCAVTVSRHSKDAADDGYDDVTTEPGRRCCWWQNNVLLAATGDRLIWIWEFVSCVNFLFLFNDCFFERILMKQHTLMIPVTITIAPILPMMIPMIISVFCSLVKKWLREGLLVPPVFTVVVRVGGVVVGGGGGSRTEMSAVTG